MPKVESLIGLLTKPPERPSGVQYSRKLLLAVTLPTYVRVYGLAVGVPTCAAMENVVVGLIQMRAPKVTGH